MILSVVAKHIEFQKIQMIKDYNDGGCRMVHVPSFIKSLKLSWIKRLFNSEATWTHLFLHHSKLTCLRAGANESLKTRNKTQETKRFSTFAVYRLRHSETKKHCLIRESCLSGAYAKQPINNISKVTWSAWLCTWFPK